MLTRIKKKIMISVASSLFPSKIEIYCLQKKKLSNIQRSSSYFNAMNNII